MDTINPLTKIESPQAYHMMNKTNKINRKKKKIKHGNREFELATLGRAEADKTVNHS